MSRMFRVPALVLALLVAGAGVADEPPGAVALIAVEPTAGGLTITASVHALAPLQARGEMQIVREGGAGNVTTRQARDVTLGAGEAGRIAEVGLSFAPGDRLVVTATVTMDGEVIASSELAMTPGSVAQ